MNTLCFAHIKQTRSRSQKKGGNGHAKRGCDVKTHLVSKLFITRNGTKINHAHQ